MADRFSTFATASMPERVALTKELEQVYREQQEAEAAASKSKHAAKVARAAQGER